MKKFTLLLSIFIGLCAACQPVESAIQPAADTTEDIIVPTKTSQPIPPTNTPQPDNEPERPMGILAFYSDRDGNLEIYTIKTDGSDLTRLTNDPAFDDSPAISPDGTQIAFLTARHDPSPNFPNLKYEIYVMNIDGSDLRRLTTTEIGRRSPCLVTRWPGDSLRRGLRWRWIL